MAHQLIPSGVLLPRNSTVSHISSVGLSSGNRYGRGSKASGLRSAALPWSHANRASRRRDRETAESGPGHRARRNGRRIKVQRQKLTAPDARGQSAVARSPRRQHRQPETPIYALAFSPFSFRQSLSDDLSKIDSNRPTLSVRPKAIPPASRESLPEPQPAGARGPGHDLFHHRLAFHS